jgi:2'-5' RNA ligase
LQRTFIAFKCKDEQEILIKELIAQGQNIYKKDISWTNPENIHFTFQFIGDTKDSDLPIISDYLKNLAQICRPFSLFDCNLKWYPFKNSPLICLMYRFHNSFLIKQHHLLNNFLKDLEYPIEDRLLNFHLTLARLKKNFDSEQIIWNDQLIQMLINIEIDKLIYYKSTLLPQGPTYECISAYDLKGGQNVHR